jgi:type IV pilus assembly PilX-like protein
MERTDESIRRMKRELHKPGDGYFMAKGNERGMALIMALVLLALLTMLGAWALDTSSTDLKIAGNYRNAQYAFSLADTTTTYATNPNVLTDACVNHIPACSSFAGANTSYSYPYFLGVSTVATVTVEYLSKGPLPIGSMFDSDVDASGKPKFSGVYFNVIGSGFGPNSATAQIETNVVQVVSN